MAPRSSDKMWQAYEDEFRAWLDAEIEMLESKLKGLLKIRDSLNKENNETRR